MLYVKAIPSMTRRCEVVVKRSIHQTNVAAMNGFKTSFDLPDPTKLMSYNESMSYGHLDVENNDGMMEKKQAAPIARMSLGVASSLYGTKPAPMASSFSTASGSEANSQSLASSSFSTMGFYSEDFYNHSETRTKNEI